jgi:triacylglycerol lipase
MLLGSGLMISAFASAATATYQYCSVSGCRAGGSATVVSNYASTKYPIVLAHGMAGFTRLAGLNITQYFYGINADLTANGAKVFVTQVASFDSSYVRGEQLLNQVQQITAITGASKVNLIGHSQGTLDARYVAGVRSDLVASVTGVGGPNQGSPVADIVKQVSDIPIVGTQVLTPVVSSAVNALFTLLDITSGQRYSQSSINGLNQLTTAGAAAFNAQFPNGVPSGDGCGSVTPPVTPPPPPPNQNFLRVNLTSAAVSSVRYYSWGGTGHLTNLLDVTDPLLLLTGALIPGADDGLVGKCSSHLGVVIRDDYPQNHVDEVNQLLGLVSFFATSPVTLYRQQANRLKNAGL